MKKYVVEVNNKEYEVLIKEETEVNNSNKGQHNLQNTAKEVETQPESNIDTINSELKEKGEKNKDNNKSNHESNLDNKNIDATGKEPVNAPMSGRILSIRVNEGDNVSQNQVLMTIEAMKMETEIVAPLNGQVTEILADEGSKCKQGDKLALIKEAGGK